MIGRMRNTYMLAALVAMLAGHGAHATSVRPVPIDEMVQRADLIFIGQPVGQTTTEQAGPLGTLVVDTWTFQVQEILKATDAYKSAIAVGATFSWKQARHGPGYAVGPGRTYCLYLRDVGEGFWATVGLIQGVFEITTHADGSRSVRNRLNNQLLFRGSKLKAASMAKGARSVMETGSGPIPLDDFKKLVETLK